LRSVGHNLVTLVHSRAPKWSSTAEWLLERVRAGREVFQDEIEAADFRFTEEMELSGLDDNYILRFERVD